MRSLTFAEWPSYPLVFLVPSLQRKEIREEYLDPFGIPHDDVLAIRLHQSGKKTPVGEMKQWICEELVPFLQEGTRYLAVGDAEYFKVLTGAKQADANLGYVLDCLYGPWKVVYVPNFRAIFRDPERVRAKIRQGMEALISHIGGTYQAPGADIVHFEAYPQTLGEIEDWLDRLLKMDCDLSIDIEAFDLKHHKAGIGTISFAWSKHEGIAFPVDYVPIEGATQAPFGRQEYNKPVRKLLRRFFRQYLKKAIYHNISYDAYVLIYQLFMQNLLDQEGMLKGMEIMLRNWDCTQLITYLATNSCAGNELGLKINSQEFSGNYSVEVEDITKVPLPKLLRYNLIDALSTWFVKEKHEPTMDRDEQREIYETLFQPAIWDIIQMQLTGLPLNMRRTKEVKGILQAIEQDALQRLSQTQVVQGYTHHLQEKHVEKRNAELKKKRISLSDPETQAVEFNPNSGPQLQEVLYAILELPVISLTKNKNPSTDADTLEALINHAKDQDTKDFLQALLDFAAVSTILTTFIPAMEDAARGPDGWHYLFGSFRLGGTVSGRLSSRNPNLQNLPANVEMMLQAALLELFPELEQFAKKGKLNLGKLIKSCFEAPPGWVLVGLDFNSLEDRISALTTKDPNKLKVYLDGYDGHCLRAHAYFGDQMPDIVDTVESINSIAQLYPKQRQDGKAPTFALTYRGTWRTLMKNCGFSEEFAKQIEEGFSKLYRVSIEWVQDHLDHAAKVGYITAAFGLRVRTPLLHQTIQGLSVTPFEAEAEGRTAGNALGQSWCLLNSRASSEFMGKVRQSEYRLDIRPCAQIHDAGYYLVRDSVPALHFTNTHLVQAAEWQDHPEIAHDEVHLGGSLSIFWPNWSKEIEIPNYATEAELIQAVMGACA